MQHDQHHQRAGGQLHRRRPDIGQRLYDGHVPRSGANDERAGGELHSGCGLGGQCVHRDHVPCARYHQQRAGGNVRGSRCGGW